MIRLFTHIAAIVFALCLSASYAQAQYKLVWNDEFSGTTLNEEAWNIEVNGNGGGNAELQYYTRDNVTIEVDPVSGENCLVLTAKKQSYNGKSFTSGRLNTADKVIFTRGKIESRIKLPKTANGLWPAFWMLGNDFKDVGWPSCGEIDIVEMGNATGISRGTQDRFFNGACHWGFYRDGAYPNYARSTTNSYSLQDDEFHIFTLEWDEEYVTMYLDRDKYPDVEPYYKMGVSDMSGEWGTGFYFQHDFFIVYDLAVGGYFTGILQPNGITALNDGDAKMYIDWVRVYQKEDDMNAIVPEDWKYVPCDVNKDGNVNVSDVTTLINMILGISHKDWLYADINEDGRINVSDVTSLINNILGI